MDGTNEVMPYNSSKPLSGYCEEQLYTRASTTPEDPRIATMASGPHTFVICTVCEPCAISGLNRMFMLSRHTSTSKLFHEAHYPTFYTVGTNPNIMFQRRSSRQKDSRATHLRSCLLEEML